MKNLVIRIISVWLTLGFVYLTHGVEISDLPALSESRLNVPKNLARSHMGASLLLVDGQRFSRIEEEDREKALIGDDEALSYLVSEGITTFVIDLGAKYPVHTFAFRSYDLNGTVTLYSSTRLGKIESPHWRKTTLSREFEEEGLVQLSFPSIDARYVRVEFDAANSGTISNVNISGDITIADVLRKGKIRLGEIKEYHAAKDHVELDLDFASLYAGSNINLAGVATREGDLFSILDENLYSFVGWVSRSNSEHVLTVDLKEPSSLDKLSLNIEGFEGSISVDSYYDDEFKTIAFSEVDSSKQLLQVDFKEASVAERVKIRFKGKSTASFGLDKDVGEFAAESTRIYEMSLIGRRIFNQEDLEEPLIILPREAVIEILNPQVPDNPDGGGGAGTGDGAGGQEATTAGTSLIFEGETQ